MPTPTFYVASPTYIDDLNDLADGVLMKFTQSGTGAVVQTMLDKVRRTIHPEDFGCVMDGVTDDAVNYRKCVAYAATLFAATIDHRGKAMALGSQVIIGDLVSSAFVSINIVGDGVVGTFINWIGATGPSQAMLKFSRNKYAKLAGITLKNNGGARGAVVGLELAGIGSGGMETNNCVFENCSFQEFHIGVCAGGLAVSSIAAAELLFSLCFFANVNYGLLVSGDGNSLNIWLKGCSFDTIANYGADFNTASSAHVDGGTATNVKNCFKYLTAWTVTPTIKNFRFEVNPTNTEIPITLTGGYNLTVENCEFQTTTGVCPSYPMISGGAGRISLRSNILGNGAESSGDWLFIGGDSTYSGGYYSNLLMEHNVIFGPTSKCFGIYGVTSVLDKLTYELRANFYGGAMHGIERGVVVWPNRVDREMIPRAFQYKADATNTAFTATNTDVAGADECYYRLTGVLAAARALTLPTAANIVAAIPGACVGMQYKLRIINDSPGAFPWTVTTNTGLTLSGALVIPHRTWRDYVVTLTSLTAVAIQEAGQGHEVGRSYTSQYKTDATNTAFTATNTDVAGAIDCVYRLTGTLTAARALTMPTAANIVAAIPDAYVGMQYRLRIINGSSGAFPWTVTTNTGLTLNGTVAIPNQTWRDYQVTLTSLTAVAFQEIGQGAETERASTAGAQTQGTSKSTGVTLDNAMGDITMHNANLGAATIVSFTLTNNRIQAGDSLLLTHQATGTVGAYHFDSQCAAGSAVINVRNNTAGILGEAIVIRFKVIKGVLA